MYDSESGQGVESQRMSVLMLILLVVVTCGIYGPIWFQKRRAFLNALDTNESISESMTNAVVVLWTVGLGLAVLAGATGSKGLEALANLATFVGGIIMLVMSFTAKRMIEQHLSRIGQYERLSGLATFFFHQYYLQYRINKLPEAKHLARHFD